MKKIGNVIEELGVKVTSVKEISPFYILVHFIDGYNNFFTKYFFTGPKGNIVSKHDGKFVLSVSSLNEGYHTGKLLEKESYFLFKPLPVQLELDEKIYRLTYKKDVWGW